MLFSLLVGKIYSDVSAGECVYITQNGKYINIGSSISLSGTKCVIKAEKNSKGGVSLTADSKAMASSGSSATGVDKTTNDKTTSMKISTEGENIIISNEASGEKTCATSSGSSISFEKCDKKNTDQQFTVETAECKASDSANPKTSSEEPAKSTASSKSSDEKASADVKSGGNKSTTEQVEISTKSSSDSSKGEKAKDTPKSQEGKDGKDGEKGTTKSSESTTKTSEATKSTDGKEKESEKDTSKKDKEGDETTTTPAGGRYNKDVQRKTTDILPVDTKTFSSVSAAAGLGTYEMII
ncbi:hypothetical protein EHP00_1156 [Ecytonucleospora hepatopenaei]|uniref:Uncharacterized protein n=1 Tax=Ecytonucleospora hepatopenaei TaxID=646526 RepID=A0A1W0E4D4_9MICR|nr:hypothetical protein EHP00_1156 [Ecytonucleospora hepatopenaei]